MRLKTQVLIAGDDMATYDLLNKALTEEGYMVFSATAEKAAMEMVKTKRPDMVLLDLMLPGKGGLDVLRRIKKINKDIAVVMIAEQGSRGAWAQRKQPCV